MIHAAALPRAGDDLKILALALLLGAVLVAIPADDLVTRTAAAVVCEPEDVECHERQARCLVRSLVEGGGCPAVAAH